MTTILSDKIITARKPHVCDECLNAINAGEKYHQQCNIYDGDFCVWKSHVDCRKIALELNKDSYSDEWYPIHDHPKQSVSEVRNKLGLAFMEGKV